MSIHLTNAHISAMKHCIGLDTRKPRINSQGRRVYRPKRKSMAVKFPNEVWTELYQCGYADHDGVRYNRHVGQAFAEFSLTKRGIRALGKQLGIMICCR